MPWIKRPRLYRIFNNMRARCYNPNFPRYVDYGGRGIFVCDAWRHYGGFRDWALANGYNDALCLERSNNDGNYDPQNCRWVTPAEQARNKRNNRLLTFDGETKPMAAWAEDSRCAVDGALLRNRLHHDWPVDRALVEPRKPIAKKQPRLITHNGETLSVHAWAKRLHLQPGVLYARANQGLCAAEILSPLARKRARDRVAPDRRLKIS